MTNEPFADAHVPDGAYACDHIIEEPTRQVVRAHALVSEDRVTVLSGASVACELATPVMYESPGLAARREHVDFSISARLVDDVELGSMTEATKLVLGRNAGWKTAASLWHDADGTPIGELAADEDGTPEDDLQLKIMSRIPAELMGAVREFLIAVDNDFVPPLSARTSAHQSQFERKYYPSMHVDAYLQSIREQRAVLAMREDVVAGMLSWEERQWGVAYVSTVAVRSALRGNGIATAMYATFEETTACPVARVRTWSNNWGHLKLLKSRGYVETGRRDNDRGYGVSSVYLEKELSEQTHEVLAS